jgi:hypothetical protein
MTSISKGSSSLPKMILFPGFGDFDALICATAVVSPVILSTILQ